MKSLLAAVLALPLVATSPALAAVNDVFPGDFVAPDRGFWSLAAYVFDRWQKGPYRDGRQTADRDVRSRIAALRLTRVFEVAGVTVAPLAVVTANAMESSQPLPPSRQTHASGLGDLRFGGTVWLVNDRDARRWVAVTGMALAPTGTYSPTSALNVGENRWRWVAMGGWVEGIGERLTVELVPELAWYGRNDRYLGANTLDQDMSWAVTGYLRWRPEERLQVYVGAQVNGGGAARINGVAQNNAPDNTRLYLGGIYHLSRETHLQFRFGRDLTIENGMATRHELSFRVVQLF